MPAVKREITRLTFREEHVVLDGHSYQGCRFENVVFSYGGGAFDFSDNVVAGLSFNLTGDLARGLVGLGMFFKSADLRAVGEMKEMVRSHIDLGRPEMSAKLS